MNRLLSLLTLIFFIALPGCIAAPSNTRKAVSAANSTNTTTTTTTSANSPTFASDEILYWYGNSKVVGTLTVNSNTTNSYYVRGQTVHNFLSSIDASGILNYNKQFCIVANFSNTVYKPVRVKAVPFASNLSGNIIERMFRIDFPVDKDNSDACNLNVVSKLNGLTTIDSSSKLTSAYSMPNICTNCAGKISTNLIKLYRVDKATSPYQLYDDVLINFNALILQIDLTSNATVDTSICSVSACSAKGFDCCIEGQCVKDGTYKTTAASDAQFSQAVAEYNSNPLSFINWPNIFNICSNIAHQPVSTGSTSTPTATLLATAQDRVNAYMSKWYCMEDVAKSAASPYARCTGTSVSGSQLAYDEVRYSLAKSCGCTVSMSEMDSRCPNWTVKPIYKTSVEVDTNITDFYCSTPPVENQIGAISNLNVAVSARSAPQRFFSTTGKNYDDIAKLPSTVLQEGDENFSYLDEINKTGGQNVSFNSKAVLGSITVDMSKAVPAKMVTVELGKTYILTTTTGIFTPCPTCSRDYWFQSFFAHPSSQRGVGLQASGYSTKRDAFESNDTLGNFEDTQFGRACYIPMTMIPLAHSKNADLQTQRLDRLKTQASYYINGYQKDWFGFNQGALIGSFDGTAWFAVGTGRRITATSTKLFLAYNAPFLDLANKTDSIVNIIPDLGNNTASNVDYDPDLAMKNPLQGTAATCQKYHQCNNDSECVTALGWEYVCADVSQFKTAWPNYDTTGLELTNQERTTTLFEILSNTISTTYTKRCVYRGSGAPCKKKTDTFSNNSGTKYNATFKKLLTCAPNFYCAEASARKFNEEIIRTPNQPENIMFGMDANVLGRPANYATAIANLPENVRNVIYHNGEVSFDLPTVEAQDLGMCRPGRLIIAQSTTRAAEADFVQTHSNGDLSKRSDYINQIGNCATDTLGKKVTTFCPVFGSDNNYYDPNTLKLYGSTLAATDYDPLDYYNFDLQATEQNMCSSEAKTNTTGVSAFKSIESLSLSTVSSIVSPTLVQDTCLRRAGSICHTDLDCGPNVMHENIASALNLTYFGGTDAEKSFWTESLICGQEASIPLKNDPKYFDYQLNKNRCCREIGKDFTMFTSTNSAAIIPDQGTTNLNLDTAQFSYLNATKNNRYSRYSSSSIAHQDSTKIPKVVSTTEPEKNQWEVLNETGTSTCCGGGWIRKFADGTHTWPIKSKLSLDATNFSCLNFRSPLADQSFSSKYASLIYNSPASNPSSSKYVSYQSYQNESNLFCQRPYEKGCIQILYADSDNFTIKGVSEYLASTGVDTSEEENFSLNYDYSSSPSGALTRANTTRLDTSPKLPNAPASSFPTADDFTAGNYTFRYSVDVPYMPEEFYSTNPAVGAYKGYTFKFFPDRSFAYGLRIYLPTYIGYNNPSNSPTFNGYNSSNPLDKEKSYIRNVYIKYYYDQTNGLVPPQLQDITDQLIDNDAVNGKQCENVINYNSINDLPINSAITYNGGVIGNTGVPILTTPGTSQGHAAWCISSTSKSFYRPILVARADTDPNSIYNKDHPWIYAGIVVDFDTLESRLKRPNGVTPLTVSSPGNPLYYLTKLSRLDLLGIPQIHYEPIYCSNDKDKLVPGIFKSTLTDRASFSSNSYTEFDPIYSYDESGDPTIHEKDQNNYGNYENRFAYQDKVDHTAVFSSKDFTCCTPLGKTPKGGKANCCSGYSTIKNNSETCTLPSGTDLNVYFNKFVSNEGIGKDLPSGGLISALIQDSDGDGVNDLTLAEAQSNIDFNTFTGEPKYRDSTFQKIFSIGTNYCSTGKVVLGVAFGPFPQEPYAGYASPPSLDTSKFIFPTSIVDSALDTDQNNSFVRKINFDLGFRWNNHYYCQ